MIKLMKNTFYNEKETKEKLCEFIKKSEKLSMGEKCKEFEIEFSKYQGRKYSVLFNSGSSANLALIQALLNLGRLNKGDKVGFSALTWSTNVMPLLQLGLSPVPMDISIKDLNVHLKNISRVQKDLKAIFITNALGFCGDIDNVTKFCQKRKIILLEDNCESLGSRLGGKKLGNFGLASTFSFFVGHHLSAIEGGMVCTDNKELCDMLVMVRAHGWGRNLDEKSRKRIKQENKIKDFYESYTFYVLGYNLRPTEITGFLGCEQLKVLPLTLRKRHENFVRFWQTVQANSHLQKLDFSHMDYISNFGFPLLFKNKKKMEFYKNKFKGKVEIRPMLGGNIVNQPFFKVKGFKCVNAEMINNLGFYLPNNPDLTEEEIKEICKLLR